jgi:DNA integrity scanning protein DisA with diadenylate cyclase activity
MNFNAFNCKFRESERCVHAFCSILKIIVVDDTSNEEIKLMSSNIISMMTSERVTKILLMAINGSFLSRVSRPFLSQSLIRSAELIVRRNLIN